MNLVNIYVLSLVSVFNGAWPIGELNQLHWPKASSDDVTYGAGILARIPGFTPFYHLIGAEGGVERAPSAKEETYVMIWMLSDLCAFDTASLRSMIARASRKAGSSEDKQREVLGATSILVRIAFAIPDRSIKVGGALSGSLEDSAGWNCLYPLAIDGGRLAMSPKLFGGHSSMFPRSPIEEFDFAASRFNRRSFRESLELAGRSISRAGRLTSEGR